MTTRKAQQTDAADETAVQTSVATTQPEKVEMSYKGIDNNIFVPAHRVARYEGRGWKRVEGSTTK